MPLPTHFVLLQTALLGAASLLLLKVVLTLFIAFFVQPIAMLACARIGALHTVVFAGFSAEALSQRLLDCK